VLDPAVASLEVNWLVHADARAVVDADGGEVHGAKDGEPVGWFSPTYRYKQAMSVVRARKTRSQEPLQIATRVRLH
jgi:hypothetical protein